jgi:hypothetical protein
VQEEDAVPGRVVLRWEQFQLRVVLQREQFQGSNCIWTVGRMPQQNNGCTVQSVQVHSSNDGKPQVIAYPGGCSRLWWNCSLQRTSLLKLSSVRNSSRVPTAPIWKHCIFLHQSSHTVRYLSNWGEELESSAIKWRIEQEENVHTRHRNSSSGTGSQISLANCWYLQRELFWKQYPLTQSPYQPDAISSQYSGTIGSQHNCI